MSYDVTFYVSTGGDHEAEVGWRNYTSNVSAMWTHALDLPPQPWLDEDGNQRMSHRPIGNGEWVTEPSMRGGLRLFDGAPASESAGVLRRGVDRLRSDPDFYRQWDARNGWGDYDGALAFLEWIAEMAERHPAATIRVSS